MPSISPTKSLVNPAVKLSYNIVKGSPEQRRALVSEYTDKIFDNFVGKIDDYSVSFKTLKESIDKALPESKNYKLKTFRETETAHAQSGFLYNKLYNIVGMTIEVPAKKRNLSQDNIISFMHELTHVVDRLVNPKYVARVEKSMQKNLYADKKYSRLYAEELYYYEDISARTPKRERDEIIEQHKAEVKDFLKGKKIGDKLDYIQDMKYSLTMEKNAFDEEHRFAKKLQARDIPADDDALNDSRKNFMFDEKIQMLKEIGMDIISKERKRHATRLKNKAAQASKTNA